MRDSHALQANAFQARKDLLARFSQFEQLARKIESMPPIVDGVTSATQKRLQQAIFARASLFLQRNVRIPYSPWLDDSLARSLLSAYVQCIQERGSSSYPRTTTCARGAGHSFERIHGISPKITQPRRYGVVKAKSRRDSR